MTIFIKRRLHSVSTGYGLDGPGNRVPVGARFSAPVQTGPRAHPASCTMGTGSFPGVKGGRGVTLTPHPLQVPWSRKSTAIPLLPLWAVRPVQKLSACTVQGCTFHSVCFQDGAMAQEVSRRLHTAEVLVQSQISQCEICGRQNG